MSGKMGEVDFSEFEEFNEKLQQLNDLQMAEFFEEASKELAARLLGLVIPKTPVGDYSNLIEGKDENGKIIYSKKKGGTLRRGWTGGKNMVAYDYAQSLKVLHLGDMYRIEVINPVDYAIYVENGHRQTPGRFVPALGKKLKESWVEGHFMLEISVDELTKIAPKVLERKLMNLFKDVFE